MSVLRDAYGLNAALTAAFLAGKEYVRPAVVATAASGNITIYECQYLTAGSNPDTIQVGPITFTAVLGTPVTNTQFDASGSDHSTAVNLTYAINNNPSTACLMTATMPNPYNPYIVLVAKTAGSAGNLLPLVYTSRYMYPGLMTSSNTFTGGSDAVTEGEAYDTLDTQLALAAADGEETFTITCLCSYEPDTLRLETKLLDAFFAGVRSGMGSEQIYDYEYSVRLNQSDTMILWVNFDFHFGAAPKEKYSCRSGCSKYNFR